ncbi:FG-GAP-like repeat-containing protein [Vibrio vulnificus]|uniref:FG-GAP-like repeat-containing protein n=1 Tax=Vibrio vulnificus TaxID=672 RepID=UPI0021D9CEF0|nr:FG-GAP-like repeat-containing protein [Vibrio vulnificus]
MTLLLLTVNSLISQASTFNAGIEEQGFASVGLNGEAQYYYPVHLPPGVNGLTPDLNIKYSSNNTYGIIGHGWTISGISSITRCKASIHVDGKNGSITGTESDKFCLDGMRLVNVSGEYGKTGSEYRTLTDNYNRVIFNNDEFIIFSPKGEKLVYKGSDTTKNNSLYWHLSSITDISGNSITYEYEQSGVFGEIPLYLRSITYNDFIISFKYQKRHNSSLDFIAGHPLKRTLRLWSIIVSDIRGSSFSQTEFNYVPNSDLLTNIQVSRIGNNGNLVNLEAFSFEWKNVRDNGFSAKHTVSSDSALNKHDFFVDYQLHDINGDGYDDLVQVEDRKLWVHFSTGNGSFASKTPFSFSRKNNDGGHTDYRFVDINNDGKTDIVKRYSCPLQGSMSRDHKIARTCYSIEFSNGNSFDSPIPALKIEGMHHLEIFGWGLEEVIFADVNGDSLMDMVVPNSKAIYVSLAQRNGQFSDFKPWVSERLFEVKGEYQRPSPGYQTGVPSAVHDIKFIAKDVNGDRLDDVVFFAKENTYLYLSDGVSFLPKERQNSIPNNRFSRDILKTISDVNGDGLSDIVIFDKEGVRPYLFNGKGFDTHERFSHFSLQNDFLLGNNSNPLVDVDGDGDMDIVGFTNSNVQVARSNSSNFSIAQGSSEFGRLHNYGMVTRLGDINGDLKVDIVAIDRSGIHVAVGEHFQPKLSLVRTSLGNISSFEYGTLSDQSVHQRGTPAVYPQRDIVKGVVVSALSHSNGLGFDQRNTVYYKYEGKKVHLNGAGSLGFEKIHSWSDANNVMTTSVYHQEVEEKLLYTALKTQAKCLITERELFTFSACSDDVYRSPLLEFVANTWQTVKTTGIEVAEARSAMRAQYNDKERVIQQLTSSVTRYYDYQPNLTSKLLKTVTVNKEYNRFYGYTKKTTTITDDHINNQTTTNIVDRVYRQPDVDKWLVQLVESESESVAQTNNLNDSLTSLNTQSKTINYSYTNNGLLEKVTRQLGDANWEHTTEYSLFDRGLPQVIKETWSDNQEFVPVEAQNLSVSDKVSLGTRLQDSSGNAVRKRVTTRAYDKYGHLNREIDSLGKITFFTIEPIFGNTTQVKLPNGHVTTTSYDAWGREVTQEESTGARVSIIYEESPEFGAVYKKVIASNNNPEVVVWFDSHHREVLRREQIVGERPYSYRRTTYNPRGEVSTLGVASSTPVPNAVTTYHHDQQGRVILQVHPDNTQTQFGYQGMSTEVTNDRNNTTTTVIDAFGRTVEIIDAHFNSVTYTYDGWGNLVQTADPKGNKVEIAYNILGHKVEMKDPDLGTIAYYTNGLGYVYKTVKNNDVVIYDIYDTSGRLVRSQALKGKTKEELKRFEYHNRTGQLISATKGLYKESFTYYPNGALKSKATKIEGQTYTHLYEYDLQGRLFRLDYGNQIVVEREYQTQSQLHTKTFIYKAGLMAGKQLVWQLKKMDSFGNHTDVHHGNLTSASYHYRHDTGKIETMKLYAQSNLVRENRYRFDALGNLKLRTEEDTSVTQQLEVKVSQEHWLDRQYHIKSKTLSFRVQRQESMDYDGLNRLKLVDTAQKVTTNGLYDAPTRVEMLADPSFDRCRFETRQTKSPIFGLAHGGLKLECSNYIDPGLIVPIDPIGPRPIGPIDGGQMGLRVHSRDLSVSSFASTTNGTSSPYEKTYDSVNDDVFMPQNCHYTYQTQVCTPSSPPAIFDTDSQISAVSVDYDEIGNITRKSDVGYYQFDSNRSSHLAGHLPHAVRRITSDASISSPILARYTYDVHGNMLSGDGRTITYNANNKPTLITKDTNSTAFKYGVNGQRYLRIDNQSQGKTITHYLDSMEIITEGSKTTFRYYIGDTAIYERVAGNNDLSQVKYFNKDHLGSIIAISNELGQIEQSFSYDAWGKRRSTLWEPQANSPLSLVGRMGFTGHEMLDDMGLIHMNGRVYDPTLARFLSADPYIQDKWFGTQAFNRYSYVQNNPLSYVDPTGLYSQAPNGMGTSSDAARAQARASDAQAMANTGAIAFGGYAGLAKSQSAVANEGGLATTLQDFSQHEDDAQFGNPAAGIAYDATKNDHLTVSQANKIWRANNDPSFEVTVDASKLTVLQTGEFNDKGIAPGRIPYAETGDWLVHGSVTLYRDGNGLVSILPGMYDFQPHAPVKNFMTVVRNVETYFGFYVASIAGFNVGTDYLINYSGSPNVIR